MSDLIQQPESHNCAIITHHDRTFRKPHPTVECLRGWEWKKQATSWCQSFDFISPLKGPQEHQATLWEQLLCAIRKSKKWTREISNLKFHNWKVPPGTATCLEEDKGFSPHFTNEAAERYIPWLSQKLEREAAAGQKEGSTDVLPHSHDLLSQSPAGWGHFVCSCEDLRQLIMQTMEWVLTFAHHSLGAGFGSVLHTICPGLTNSHSVLPGMCYDHPIRKWHWERLHS